MRELSSCLFRGFNQDKSMWFQDGARVSCACCSVDFAGVLRTIVSLPPPRLSRSHDSAHVGSQQRRVLSRSGIRYCWSPGGDYFCFGTVQTMSSFFSAWFGDTVWEKRQKNL